MLLRLCRNKRAQTTAEYAILFGLVVGALIAMQVYIRRGLQSRVKDVVDFTGAGGAVGDAGNLAFTAGGQYEPYYSNVAGKSDTAKTDVEDVKDDGSINRSITGDEVNKGTRKTVTGWGVEEGVEAPIYIED